MSSELPLDREVVQHYAISLIIDISAAQKLAGECVKKNYKGC